MTDDPSGAIAPTKLKTGAQIIVDTLVDLGVDALITIGGDDTEALQEFTEEAKQRLAMIDGISDLTSDTDRGKPEIRVKDEKVGSIARAERNKAHQLIEEFMLAANETVAVVFALFSL